MELKNIFYKFDAKKNCAMKRETLKDLAEITGYSITTICRVLNGKAKDSRISDKTVQSILDKLKSLHLNSDINAQNLRINNSYIIGVILPFIKNPFFANLASAIIDEAKANNYSVILMDTLEDSNLEKAALEKMKSKNVDGVILVPCGNDPKFLEQYSKTMPIILVDRYFKKSNLPYISTNNFEGAYSAMKLLILSGHKNILCISGPQISITTKERVLGCWKAVKEIGDSNGFCIKGNQFSIQNGYMETMLALNRQTRPTAIFALSNTILLGVIEAINELKLRIPEDVSLISFDDDIYLDYLNPPITRVAQPISSIGRTALKLLVDSIKNNQPINSTIIMTPKIIKRNSIKLLR